MSRRWSTARFIVASRSELCKSLVVVATSSVIATSWLSSDFTMRAVASCCLSRRFTSSRSSWAVFWRPLIFLSSSSRSALIRASSSRCAFTRASGLSVCCPDSRADYDDGHCRERHAQSNAGDRGDVAHAIELFHPLLAISHVVNEVIGPDLICDGFHDCRTALARSQMHFDRGGQNSSLEHVSELTHLL